MTLEEQNKIMKAALTRIAKDYCESEEIDDDYAEEYGLERDEALQMAYDNMKWEAQAALSKIEDQATGEE